MTQGDMMSAGKSSTPSGNTKIIRFRLRYITRDFAFKDARIACSDPARQLDLTLVGWVPDNSASKAEPGDGEITTTCAREVTDRLYNQAVSTGQISVKQEAVRDVFDDMQNFLLRALRLIRWRTKSPGRPYPIRLVHGFMWSLDGVEWKSVADYLTISIRQVEPPPQWTTEAAEFVNTELLGELDEPLGHELLREAWTNRETNFRSAVVLAVAAAEVEFKQFAARALPGTAWILENLQSPPLVKMLERFPWDALKLQINGKNVTVPDSIKESLRTAVTLRNSIVHGSAAKLTLDTVESVLFSVRDLLYFLDTLAGPQRWAFDHLRREARMHYA
jgi:hypothetical protein